MVGKERDSRHGGWNMSSLEDILLSRFSADHKEFDRTSKNQATLPLPPTYLFVSPRTPFTLFHLIFAFFSSMTGLATIPSRISAALF